MSFSSQVETVVTQSWSRFNQKFDTCLDKSITDPNYWPSFQGRVTTRKSGEVVVGGYRNIYDLGNLHKSKRIYQTSRSCIWSWNGLGITPAYTVWQERNWIRVAINEVTKP